MVTSRLQTGLTTIQGRYGPRALQLAGGLPPLDVLPTGLPPLDQALGVGGLPRGRISLLRGPSGSGKRSLAEHCLAVASREGFAAYLDTTGSLDPAYLDFLGADLRRTLVIRPQTPDEAWSAAVTLARAGMPFLVLELEAEQALPEAALSAMPAAGEQGQCAVLVVVDERPQLPLDQAASLRLEIQRESWRYAHGDITGIDVVVRVTKNKLALPGKAAALRLTYPHPVLQGTPLERIRALPAASAAWPAEALPQLA